MLALTKGWARNVSYCLLHGVYYPHQHSVDTPVYLKRPWRVFPSHRELAQSSKRLALPFHDMMPSDALTSHKLFMAPQHPSRSSKIAFVRGERLEASSFRCRLARSTRRFRVQAGHLEGAIFTFFSSRIQLANGMVDLPSLALPLDSSEPLVALSVALSSKYFAMVQSLRFLFYCSNNDLNFILPWSQSRVALSKVWIFFSNASFKTPSIFSRWSQGFLAISGLVG